MSKLTIHLLVKAQILGVKERPTHKLPAPIIATGAPSPYAVLSNNRSNGLGAGSQSIYRSAFGNGYGKGHK